MLEPTFQEVQHYASTHNFIPIRLTLLADQETPISLYQKCTEEAAFLLESVEGGGHWSRYSFIGLRPFLRLEAIDQKVTLLKESGEREQCNRNPMEVLRKLCQQYRAPSIHDFPPLTGGAIGYLGYNTLRYVETQLPKHQNHPLDIPDMHVVFVDEMLVYDHVKQEIQCMVHLRVSEEDTEESLQIKYAKAGARLVALRDHIMHTAIPSDLRLQQLNKISQMENLESSSKPSQVGEVAKKPKTSSLQSNMTLSEYETMISKAKEYIASGDIFQVVLSQRMTMKTNVDPFAVYRMLRTTNPSPYLYYLPLGSATLVGASPEVLVKVQNNKVEVRPIAGTRKRGATNEEDLALEQELLADPKELAEHHMLVDLARNDVGRVSKYGTVKVENPLHVDRYSHVMHIVSDVSGEMREDLDCFDALLAAFPAGTVSGAPKLRAMEIIAELERDARHTYAGSICYFSFTGNLDSCITIRTLLFTQDQVHIQAGGGIVADSVAELEYQEAMNKAAAMVKALEKAEQLFQPKGVALC
ncbi:anthranilate synthase component I [Brevibacillus laterosporus]|uniref:anthranilate synthase component I n=1 Tax=Brevibacillus laterosporus TaxID=1465 RepID=UPI001443E7B0|nr:anthranilate synthase component I [Brevibacillus laterosporus]NKQ18298.1 anthranilate synthase component I [Brevibacillus laterosporus]WNX33072.1 anthranilate synthase component I [Brevibacillus laterosporus]